MKRTGSFLILFLFTLLSIAQTKNAFLVSFSDKTFSDKKPSLSKETLAKRSKNQIETDIKDYPVNQHYISKVLEDESITMRYSLRWKNAIVVESDDSTLDLSKHPFVTQVNYVGITKPAVAIEKPANKRFDAAVKNSSSKTQNIFKEDYGVSFYQNNQIGAIRMHQLGFDGNGVKIAVFDAGFKNINDIPGFLSHQGQGRIRSGFDVVDLDNELTDTENHGTAVTSCSGAYQKGKYIGTAPNAEYILFRTENGVSEYPLEELNWCKAAEIADSIGVDLITSSLGYTQYFDTDLSYTHADLDGKTSYVSGAASTAVAKGIIVLNSAGNEGSGSWKKIGTPADVPAVITVGAVDVYEQIGRFSSRGYNASGVIKPDVCGIGVETFVASSNGSYYQGFGTSYSTPVVAGAVACLYQANPTLSPQQIASYIHKSASRNHKPDSAYGYGVIRVDLAHALIKLDNSERRKGKPRIIESENDFAIYNADYSNVNYKLYSEKRFLLVFKKKTLVKEEEIQTAYPITHVEMDKSELDCTAKYTLIVNLKSDVNNYKLKSKALSICLH